MSKDRVTKADWTIFPMPDEFEGIVINKKLSQDQIDKIKLGYLPEGLNDRWFAYYENNKLYIHRSWNGTCLYMVDINDSGILPALVNRDPMQNNTTNAEADAEQISAVIDKLFLK